MPKIILSNTWLALLLCIFSKIQKVQCRFFVSVQSHVNCAPGALRTAPPPCPEHRTRTWLVPGVGGTLARLRRRIPRWQNLSWRPTGGTLRHNAVRHRPSHLGAPRGRLPCQRTHAAPSPWPGTHRARSLPPTCRTAVPSGTGRNHPCRAKLDTGMAPVLRLDDAQASNPTVQPQRRRNRSPDLSVHGNRLGPAINSTPRACSRPRTTPPPHQTPPSHWKSLEGPFFLSSGHLVPPRPPP